MTYLTSPSVTSTTKAAAFEFEAWLDGRKEVFNLRVVYGTGSRDRMQQVLRQATGQKWSIGSDPVCVGTF